jgi:hypothetical protein
MVGIPKQIAMTTLRWTAGWALVGILVGIGMMVGRVELIAEPGSSSGNIFDFSFWILFCWGGGSVLGLVMGFVFASLMALSQKLEIGSGHAVGKWGMRLVCGTVAGTLVLWWGWLGTRSDTRLVSWEGVEAGAALGFVSAVVSGIAARIGEARRHRATVAEGGT